MHKTLLTAAVLFFTLFSPVLEGAAKVIKNVRVTVDGAKQYYVLFQSPVEPSLWYCGQSKPSILMRKAGDIEIPEVSLIRYQKKDLKNPQNLIEGAHFRMNLSLGPSDEVLEILKSKVPKSSDGRPVILSPVPFGALKVFFQRSDGKEVELKAEHLSGISTSHSSRNVSFSTELGTLDTDLMDALMRGYTGAKYALFYNYQYNDPVFNKGAGQNRAEQGSTSPGNPGNPSPGRDLPGSRDFDQIDREAEEKAGWEKAGEGFIGFGKYPRSVQDLCILIEKDSSQWQNAYLTLPVINNPGEITIKSIELDVSLVHSSRVYSNQKLTWTPERGWRDRFKAPLVYGVFDLTKVRQQHPDDFNSAYFVIGKRIESAGGDVLTGESTCELITGDSSISDPLSLADVLEFQCGYLSWSDDPKNGLQSMEIELSEGNWKSVRTIRPVKEGNRLEMPGTLQWLIRHGTADDSSALIAKVYFVVMNNGSGKKIPWALNGKNLRRELFALSTIFFDQDWSGK